MTTTPRNTVPADDVPHCLLLLHKLQFKTVDPPYPVTRVKIHLPVHNNTTTSIICPPEGPLDHHQGAAVRRLTSIKGRPSSQYTRTSTHLMLIDNIDAVWNYMDISDPQCISAIYRNWNYDDDMLMSIMHITRRY